MILNVLNVKICQFSYIATLKYNIMNMKCDTFQILLIIIIEGSISVLCELLTSALWLFGLVSLEIKLRDELNLWLRLEKRERENTDHWHLEISFTIFFFFFFIPEVPKHFTMMDQKSNLEIGGWWLKQNIIFNYIKMYILKSNSRILSPFQYKI